MLRSEVPVEVINLREIKIEKRGYLYIAVRVSDESGNKKIVVRIADEDYTHAWILRDLIQKVPPKINTELISQGRIEINPGARFIRILILNINRDYNQTVEIFQNAFPGFKVIVDGY